MKTKILTTAALAALCFSFSGLRLFAANLIQNGSFETGPGPGTVRLAPGSTAINGWRVTRATIDYVTSGGWNASDGGCCIDLDGNDGDSGGMAQTFSTVSNASYSVSFDLAGNPGHKSPNDYPRVKYLCVTAAGQSVVYSFDTTGHTSTSMGWTNRTWLFTANSTSTTLEFYSLDSPEGAGDGPALDNVVVTNSLCDLVTNSLSWDNSSGGVNFQYEVRSNALANATTAKLFWTSGTTANDIIPGAPTIFTQNIPVGAFGMSAVVPVLAANFANPPATATHVLLILDPDNLVQESNEGNNVMAISNPQCIDVILGAVSGPTVAPNGHCISANFTPKLGYSLAQAASLCDYDHFNWYSLVERDLHPPGSVTSPYVDPPSGGGPAFGGFADNLPFYWDETGSSSSIYYLANHMTTRSLDFGDCPGEPSLQPGEYISYVTSLVGVFPNGKFDILNSFEWFTDYNGSVGGIGVRRNLIEPTGGTSGGTVVVQTNLVVYNLPAELLQRMIADGALNAAPPLAVWRTGSGITISWPASATNYVLESAFALGISSWTNVVGVVSNSVTLPISSNGMFYRLRK